ncbi:DnaJ subfamily B protein [Thecamonas trahens ATCC 50062]|uniref:DnaJ subfamily B protein n=1 Tax=Thecamonas trahens ATCC 50062 TaxID=461836 RepID=A0A0L0DW24_THETB|nr:DnaJ subfamily B protein [Thecamonas trahens ATCC 50062]KNC56276.1 DnaJ subfamily B protein [Thecamonas trahens ATCC 50062]|eukprot:XP_013760795.1 DnaJ subfamily B protein [Thecamonas trahens ATCC 50062]
MNADEAQRCVDIARKALARGDFARARKFASKSLQLHENPDARQVLQTIAEAEGGSGGGRGGSGGSGGGGSSAAAASSSSAAGGAGSAGGGKAAAGGTSAVPQGHVDVIRKVLQAKNDYYAVLGVAKTASGKEIKKAYRKMALKLHPDKNTAPGAKEAFTSVQKAYDCLSDESRRSDYDSIGFDREDAAAAPRARPEYPMHPDDIFEQLFRTHFARQSGHYRAGGRGGGFQRGRSPFAGSDGGAFTFNIAQMLPLLFVLVMVLLSATDSGAADPSYSLFRDATYAVPRFTRAEGIIYFVKPDFDASVATSASSLLAVERQVASDWRAYLAAECRHQSAVHQRLVQEAASAPRASKEEATRVAHEFATPACSPSKLDPSQPISSYRVVQSH